MVAKKLKQDTAKLILDIALQLVQERGYNAFSYADIADKLGIRRAAIHYHFPNKEDLGRELVIYYREVCLNYLKGIDLKAKEAPEKLRQYIQVDIEMVREGRMCLGGMMAAEFLTLSDSIVFEVESYFAEQQKWLTKVLEDGRAANELNFEGHPDIAAKKLLAALEGAMLLARTQSFEKHFNEIANLLLADLGIRI